MGKKRHKNHVIDKRGKLLLERLLPSEWIVRELPDDYGVDFEIELVADEEVLGQRVWVQLKTTERAKRTSKRFKVRDSLVAGGAPETVDVTAISFQLDRDEIAYAFACPFPLLLMVADLSHQDIYWTPIQKAVEISFPNRPLAELPADPVLHVPLWTSLSEERMTHWPGIKWMSLEMPRAYALNQIHQLYYGYSQSYTLSGYCIGEGYIEGDGHLLMASLKAAKNLLSFVLSRQVLFGEQGVEWYIGNSSTDLLGGSYGKRFYLALAEIQSLIDELVGGEYTFQGFGARLTNVAYIVDLIGSFIYSFEGFDSRYVFCETTAVLRHLSKQCDSLELEMPLEKLGSTLPGNWGSGLRGEDA